MGGKVDGKTPFVCSEVVQAMEMLHYALGCSQGWAPLLSPVLLAVTIPGLQEEKKYIW